VDTSGFHQSDDRLELYALGRLPGSEVEQIEEHLLVCPSCIARLEETGAFALTAREDLKTRAEPPGRRWPGWLKPFFAMPALLAAALVALGVYWAGGARRLTPVVSRQLIAMRGEMQTVEPARETDLTLTDAPAGGEPFRVEVVDASGAGVWRGVGAEARIRQRLAPGDYFVRLFSSRGQLLHEYGFHVKG
jgi:hypothetical protein